jgi:hypothetical protein
MAWRAVEERGMTAVVDDGVIDERLFALMQSSHQRSLISENYLVR